MVQLAGEFINAEDIVPVRMFRKQATESVTSSTAFQDDDDITGIPLAANKTYLCQFYGSAIGDPAADIQIQWQVAGGGAFIGTRSLQGPETATANPGAGSSRLSRANGTTAIPYGCSATVSCGIEETFMVETTTAGTSGTLGLRWAQNTSNATATQLSSATFLIVTEIEAN